MSSRAGELPAPNGGLQQTTAVVFDGDGRLDVLDKPYRFDPPRVDDWLNLGHPPAAFR